MNGKTLPKNWLAQYISAWTGQAFSLLGSSLVSFALIWWLTIETGKATTLTLATLMSLLPQVVIAPLAGAVVDRWNRKLVMVLADGLVALVTVWLVALFWNGLVEVWHVYLALFLRSSVGSFQFPAWQASTSLMVPVDHLARIQGFNRMLGGLMNIGAPALGALLLNLMPIAQVLMVDILTAALAIGLILFVRIPQPLAAEAAADRVKASVWADMRAGLRFIFGWPGLLIIGGMALLINLVLAPASSLIPILVTKHFDGQAYELAWMESAFGFGVIAGGLLLGLWGGFKRKIYTSLMGFVILAVSFAAIGFTPENRYWLAVAMMIMAGLSSPIIDGPIMAMGQAKIPPEMQGRVFTIIASFTALMTPVGLLVAGPMADAFGIQMWFVLGGVVTGLLGIGGFFVPALVHFEEGRPAVVVEPEQVFAAQD